MGRLLPTVEPVAGMRTTFVEPGVDIRRMVVEPGAGMRGTFVEPLAGMRNTVVKPEEPGIVGANGMLDEIGIVAANFKVDRSTSEPFI